jgi:CHAT domain-containing protein/tetratricopeptide (TPR) repeat protein
MMLGSLFLRKSLTAGSKQHSADCQLPTATADCFTEALFMDYQAFITQLEDPVALPALAQSLDDAQATALVDHLKAEADRHWWINANRSLELADLIMQIGRARGDTCQVALGTMARGDALRMLGHTEAAWDALGAAGELFQQCGDEIGWARTRIGRLLICVDLNRVAEALNDATLARDILTRYGVYNKRLILDLNTAIVYSLLGEHTQALALFESTLRATESLIASGQNYDAVLHTAMALLCNSIGYEHHVLGDFRRALVYHERARALMLERNEKSGVVLTELNIAQIAIFQGHYCQALQLLHRALNLCIAEQLTLDATHVRRHMVECYLLLNRYAEARELAQLVVTDYRADGAAYREALALLYLATAEAELMQLDAAQAALDAAQPIFASLDATAMVATIQLRRGRIALQGGNIKIAQSEALAAAASFQANRQQVDYAAAMLLYGQALVGSGAWDAAAQASATALGIAQRSNVPALRYSAHLLLGRIAELRGDLVRARRRYIAAIATIERVQQGLTITLRPGFLEDKGEALRAVLALDLRAGRIERAFESLERAKSQALLGYLANRDRLRWSVDDPRNRALIDELERLREEHQWFYRLAHEQPIDKEAIVSAFTPQQALAEVATRERRMRNITEQLHIQNDERGAMGIAAPRLRDLQHSLGEETLLIEFYNDGTNLWAFTLDAHTLHIHQLPATVAEIDQLLGQLQINLAAALKAGPHATAARGLSRLAQRILGRLYAMLLAPFESRMADRARLIVVPYGSLHYLPFHVLHSGTEYLIERAEVVVLPAASLASRQPLARQPGARVLAHSWEGRLPQTQLEARIVQQLFGGEFYREQTARRTALEAEATQILHIAAHGEHRLDQPDLSYIQLADGQLYMGDLLQQDMSYELVTLSACETGRANVAARDELIGLGQGFLYAGAGALLVSLWRVDDALVVQLMERFYLALYAGESKAGALRAAQRAILAHEPHLHPAHWGAFQLVGDAGPLSTHMNLTLRKEHTYEIHTTA